VIFLKKLHLVFLIGIMIIFCGCFNDKKDPEVEKWTKISKQKDLYKKLSEEVGMNFPEDIKILNHDNGEGRIDGYYEWLISSSSMFEMPEMNQPGVDKYLKMPLENSIKVIESRLNRHELKNVRKSYLSEWEKGDYTFRGHVVITFSDNYLLIERYIK